VGAIFRTADGAGVAKIFLSGYTPIPYDPKNDKYELQAHRQISKTALGAEKNISWEKYKRIGSLLAKLKKEKLKIYALEKTDGSENIFKAKIKLPCALILGNEVKGIDPKILKNCDAILEIPMRGKKESLNVAVAAGVAMYEFLK
jgi:23S rRNA (guanosine2251-2'-O)-methyltransferase